ncbi:hypothetical protein N9N28_07205 [Rubripirellula amarantea]|uniref:Tetratricopeptide repeat protein n=1 Tax=Rubripirellula amarantea TaxID=2527999 RepID=A0A5C5WJT6_9BACT|nr:hypothetical protein [Rubripirellula amarantea]MDA8744401.1 hypothetical protein [Rubripirellula amarantea]TWT50837.1 hypothetical protein Pla22_35800 [Rubripirellula amarantea]
MELLATRNGSVESLQRVFDHLCDQWTGCNWKTAVGPLRLNLKNVRARQARLISEATSGDESAAWNLAMEFLASIENDALAARKSAETAMALMCLGKTDEAIAMVDRAVELEAKYRDPVVWTLLRDAVGG